MSARTGAFFLGLALLGAPLAARAETPAMSPAECQALRDRLGEHLRVSAAGRRALGLVAPAPAAAAPATAARVETVRTRLGELREERRRMEDEQVGALLRLEFGRLGQIKERIQRIDEERRTLEAELAALEQGAAPAPSRAAPSGPDLARAPCQDLPAMEEKVLKARRWELGGSEALAALVPLLPLRGQSEREAGVELQAQLGTGGEARQRLGLLDQDGDTRVDGFADSPGAGLYRLYRLRGDGSLAVDLFLTAPPAADAPYGEAARRIEEALLRQTRRGLADLLALRPVGPVKVLGETGQYARLRGLADAGQFDQVLQAGALGARSEEFQNYRGETVRRLGAVAGLAGAVQVRTTTVVVGQDGAELWEETVARFRPVSWWRTDVEVEQGREVKGGPAPQPRSTTMIRFSLER
jgi:hypothetical protein